MGSHIVRVRTVGDLRKALAPFADECPIDRYYDVKYQYENEGCVYISASPVAELSATYSQQPQESH